MRVIVAAFISIQLVSAQDSNCDFNQNVSPDQTYAVSSPGYSRNYTPGVTCRWIATCPSRYNCRLECPDINIPQTAGCTMDRLLVSRTGDAQLAGAEQYCGRGTLNVVSTGQKLSVGLITSTRSPGGRFYCTLTAQPASGDPDPNCRCGYKKSNRIVGGVETGINEFPPMAAVVDVSIYSVKCGGCIISPRHILTAAHCLANQRVNNIAVIVGEHDVTKDDSPARGYRASSFIIHPSYNSNNFDNDIAIIVLNGTIVYNDAVGPVCLPYKHVNTDFTNKIATLLGWGTMAIGGEKPNALRKVDVKLISESQCKSATSSFVSSRQICNLTPGKDACQDDSGGPALYTDPSNGLLYSVGIISSGQSCASNKPGINTRVTSYLSWIESVTRTTFCVK